MENSFLQAIRAAPGDALNWAAWSDWRQDSGGEAPGIALLRQAFERLARFPGKLQKRLPTVADLLTAWNMLLQMEEQNLDALRAFPRSLIHVEDHLAQICLDVSWTDNPYFNQWIFFDDLWASAHAELADAMLRYAARWDVLSVQ